MTMLLWCDLGAPDTGVKELVKNHVQPGMLKNFPSPMALTRWLFQRARGDVVPDCCLVAGWREARPCFSAIKAAVTGDESGLRPDVKRLPLLPPKESSDLSEGKKPFSTVIGTMIVYLKSNNQPAKAINWCQSSGNALESLKVLIAFSDDHLVQLLTSNHLMQRQTTPGSEIPAPLPAAGSFEELNDDEPEVTTKRQDTTPTAAQEPSGYVQGMPFYQSRRPSGSRSNTVSSLPTFDEEDTEPVNVMQGQPMQQAGMMPGHGMSPQSMPQHYTADSLPAYDQVGHVGNSMMDRFQEQRLHAVTMPSLPGPFPNQMDPQQTAGPGGYQQVPQRFTSDSLPAYQIGSVSSLPPFSLDQQMEQMGGTLMQPTRSNGGKQMPFNARSSLKSLQTVTTGSLPSFAGTDRYTSMTNNSLPSYTYSVTVDSLPGYDVCEDTVSQMDKRVSEAPSGDSQWSCSAFSRLEDSSEGPDVEEDNDKIAPLQSQQDLSFNRPPMPRMSRLLAFQQQQQALMQQQQPQQQHQGNFQPMNPRPTLRRNSRRQDDLETDFEDDKFFGCLDSGAVLTKNASNGSHPSRTPSPYYQYKPAHRAMGGGCLLPARQRHAGVSSPLARHVAPDSTSLPLR